MKGCKIGRNTTATYYLHELLVDMELVCPKKGIYKDGHERLDTVQARNVYNTAKLRHFKDRECTFTGEKLETFVPPKDTTSPEVIRVYHDKSSYASREGALSLCSYASVRILRLYLIRIDL